MKLLHFLFVLIYAVALAKEEDFNTGNPFGQISAAQIDDLFEYARSKGFDLRHDVELAYDGDDEALNRFFHFSLNLEKLDDHARAYGQIVYSSFLNLAEHIGVERYSQGVVRQPAAVRQRIRDFIFFDATQAPKNLRHQVQAEARNSAPILFPKDYKFSADDPIFKKG